MNWNASWIWHSPRGGMDNFYMHARKSFRLACVPEAARLSITASSLYKLYVNEGYVGRGPNPSDPCRYYYDTYHVSANLRKGDNVVAVLAYNYGPETRGILGQNWGRGGLLVELRAPGEDGDALLVSDKTWRVLQSRAWQQDAPVNCTLYGDFKEVYDSRRELEGWTKAGFDDSAWETPEVLGRPPAKPSARPAGVPWTQLVAREIPFLGGERVYPVNVHWESASVTYSWRDDWEVYDEWSLVPRSPRARKGHLTRVFKTHADLAPSLLLDFGRDVTGYPEITVADSKGGVIDVLYGEGLFLTRVDTFVLKGGRQVLQPYNRRTFRYMKLLFRETPEPVHVAEASIRMDAYPAERAGSFRCSDGLLNRIYEVGVHTIRISMLDHFVDCPWRERTLYGGDLYAENLIAHYAFGDPRMNRKCLRQMAAIQYDEGALPPYGPYRGCDSFYPAWSAYWGLSFLDHYDLTGDREFLDELWPNLRRLLGWAIGQARSDAGLIGEPRGRVEPLDKGPRANHLRAWMAAERSAYTPWTNFPFYLLLRRSGEVAARLRKRKEPARYAQAADRMAEGIRRRLVDAETGLCHGSADRPQRRRSGQYDNGLLLWSGLPEAGAGQEAARRAFGPDVSRITSPFHGLFVLMGLCRYGQAARALQFMREYWGDMIARGATTFWEHFSLDWPPGAVPERGVSYCHGWSAAPVYVLPAHVLGVRPLEPGFARLLVEPEPGDLGWAEGEVPTPHGAVRVSWARNAEEFHMELTVPEGCAARVSPPPVRSVHAATTVDGESAHAAPEGERSVVEVEAGRHEVVLA